MPAANGSDVSDPELPSELTRPSCRHTRGTGQQAESSSTTSACAAWRRPDRPSKLQVARVSAWEEGASSTPACVDCVHILAEQAGHQLPTPNNCCCCSGLCCWAESPHIHNAAGRRAPSTGTAHRSPTTLHATAGPRCCPQQAVCHSLPCPLLLQRAGSSRRD